MPPTKVNYFQDANGFSAVVTWLEELKETDTRAYTKCVAAIHRLEQAGYELRRPTADL